jgi:hypothetical protein
MQHILSDEEFEDYNRIKNEHNSLKVYKDDFIKNCIDYANKNQLPCSNHKSSCAEEYYCDNCVIGELSPRDFDFGKEHLCPLGKYKNYSK